MVLTHFFYSKKKNSVYYKTKISKKQSKVENPYFYNRIANIFNKQSVLKKVLVSSASEIHLVRQSPLDADAIIIPFTLMTLREANCSPNCISSANLYDDDL